MHQKESCSKVAECIYHHVCVTGKVVIKLRNVDIITFVSQGKLLSSCRMYISSRVHHNESSSKVAECIYHQACVTRKVVIKLRNVFYITCASEGTLVHVMMYTFRNLLKHRESCYASQVAIKLQNVYIMTCPSQRELL